MNHSFVTEKSANAYLYNANVAYCIRPYSFFISEADTFLIFYFFCVIFNIHREGR